DHARAVRVFLGEVQARVLHRADGCRQAELGEAVEPLGFADIDAVLADVELRALPAEADRILADVPARHRPDAALAGTDVLPDLVHNLAEGGDEAHSGNDDATGHIWDFGLRILDRTGPQLAGNP